MRLMLLHRGGSFEDLFDELLPLTFVRDVDDSLNHIVAVLVSHYVLQSYHIVVARPAHVVTL